MKVVSFAILSVMSNDLILYLVVIPVCLLFVPWLLVRHVFKTQVSVNTSYAEALPYLGSASAMWLLGFILPNIPLTPESQSTTLHAAGGVVAGLLAAYALKAYGMRFARFWQPVLFFFAFACVLGVLNELLELGVNVSGLAYIHNVDTNWDLVANTIGISLFTVAWYAAGGWRE